MTVTGSAIAPRHGGNLLGGLLADRHFLAAAIILAASAAGWSVLVSAFHLATVKHPVPWPAGVVVNDEFRMTSLPERMGPYAFVTGDGVLDRNKDGTPHKDGVPDGLGLMSKETLNELRIGTGDDPGNLPLRRSNWFMIRTYEDTRLPVNHPMRYWRLEVYYYTGGVDLVPHVPEICGKMAGADPLRTENMPLRLAQAPAAWGTSELNFHKAVLLDRDRELAQYYIFSLNGVPENSRTTVRLTLASPFVRHAYFAKMQFYPLYLLPDSAEADGAAKEFASSFLPEVLKALPMPEDIRKLDQSGGDVK